MRSNLLLSLILIVMSVALTGCFHPYPEDINAFLKPTDVSVTSSEYVLMPPDSIEIYCDQVPEIHMQNQRILSDGTVSFQTVGKFLAAGKTPDQLSLEIQAKVQEIYELPGENPINVRVSMPVSKVFHVLGQVNTPGPKLYTGRNTLLTALSEAGITVMAWEQRIQVIRPSEELGQRPKIFQVDYTRMTAHGEAYKNVLLQEGDIIYVPATILATAGLIVEEIARPIGRAFSTGNIVSRSGSTGYGGFDN
jgi:protein involved in polysaccharide export with SLBB domain